MLKIKDVLIQLYGNFQAIVWYCAAAYHEVIFFFCMEWITSQYSLLVLQLRNILIIDQSGLFFNEQNDHLKKKTLKKKTCLSLP